MVHRLDGKQVAQSVYESLEPRVRALSIVPKLVVLLVGNDPASHTYVGSKTKQCAALGLQGETLRFPETISEIELCACIERLNQEDTVHGILIQLPLPHGLSRHRIIQTISPHKDVDGLHASNLGSLLQGKAEFLPCTPHGIIRLLDYYHIPIASRHVVVVGRSEIVGKPAAHLFLNRDATVTLCHSKTTVLEDITRQADILVVAAGRQKLIGASHVKEGAVVIDVGIHRTSSGLVGDVDFEAVASKVSAITPVPGGVGPMTIAMLMEQVVLAAERISGESASPW